MIRATDLDGCDPPELSRFRRASPAHTAGEASGQGPQPNAVVIQRLPALPKPRRHDSDANHGDQRKTDQEHDHPDTPGKLMPERVG